MTKRPKRRSRLRKPAAPRGAACSSCAIGSSPRPLMVVAGVLLWKPWAHEAPTTVAQARRRRGRVRAAAKTGRAATPRRRAAIAPTPCTRLRRHAGRAAAALAAAPSAHAGDAGGRFRRLADRRLPACWTPPAGAYPTAIPTIRGARRAEVGRRARRPAKARQSALGSRLEAAGGSRAKSGQSCDPLKVPDKYAPYYTQWKTKTVYFDPTRS